MKNILIITQVVDRKHPVLGFFHRWIEEFSKHYAKVTVLCLQKGDYSLPENVTVKSLGKEQGAGTIRILWTFYRQAFSFLVSSKREGEIFVHMNEIYTLLLSPFILLRKYYGVRVLWWKCHAHINCLIKMGRFFVDKIITCSEYTIPLKTKKRVVLSHGIDSRKFVPPSVSRDEKLIISVGRIMRVKRYEVLIDAVSRMKSKKDVRVEIIGLDSVGNQEYVRELQDQIKQLDLQDVVSLEEAVTNDEIVSMYQRASVFVSASHTALDKVGLEAMSCGTIPVTANRAYQKVLEGYDLAVDPDDIDALAEKLDFIMTLPVSQKETVRNDMRNLIEKEYDITRLIERIANL